MMSGPNACSTPETFRPDPNFRTVKIPDIKAYGIDMDGRNSRAKGKPAPGTCAHNDLVGMNGERGIDNQFFRSSVAATRINPPVSPTAMTIEMQTGSWGISDRLERCRRHSQ